MKLFTAPPLVLVWWFDVVIAAGAPIANYYFTDNADIGLEAGSGAIAVATFAGIWTHQRRDPKVTSTDAVRDSIAMSFVMVYLVIVGWSSFFNWLDASAKPIQNPLTATFTTNFTALTGVVVAFYFGSQTIERVAESRRKTALAPPSTDEPPARGGSE